MKKILAMILSFALLVTVVVIPTCVAASTTYLSKENLKWDGSSSVNSKGSYMRVKELANGSVAGVWYEAGDGIYFGKSYDGGVTFSDTVCVQKNTYDADRHDNESDYDGFGRLEAQNPNIIELSDGKLMVTYRYNTFTTDTESKPWDNYYTSISYKISDDGGISWSDNCVAKSFSESGHNVCSGFGYWEPDPVYIGETLYLYFADTVTYRDTRYQNILGCAWNGASFGDTFIVQDGRNHISRDGMSVITKMSDGNYAMVIESNDTADRAWQTIDIKISTSADGVTWTSPVTVASPKVVIPESEKDYNNTRSVCASPYIITLPDGRIAISYQTTDAYETNIAIPDFVAYKSVMQVMISNEPVTANTVWNENLFTIIDGVPFENTENQFSRSASLFCKDSKLLCYAGTGNNYMSDDTVKQNTTGVKVGYINLEDKNGIYDTLDNYKVYKNGTAPLKDDNGITFKNGCTKLVHSKEVDDVSVIEAPVDGLYSVENYTYGGDTDRFTFDSANSMVVNGNTTTRAYVTETADMTAFRASALISGNSAGSFYVGFGFHLQTADFAKNGYSTSGYTVHIKRTTTSKTVTVMIRYITGEMVKKEFSESFELLTSAKTDKIRLTVWSDNESFYIIAANEDGSKTSRILTYALDITNAYPTTSYYSSGAFSLTANGIHTFSELSLSDSLLTPITVNQTVNATNLDASADFTFAEGTSTADIGYVLRVNDTTNSAPGLTGYVLKLLHNTTFSIGTIKLQLTRYGKDSGGNTNVNLGNIKTVEDATVLNGNAPNGQTLTMAIKVRGKNLSATLTNKAHPELTSTYTFDLTGKSGNYTDYYEEGGFGFYKNGNLDVTVSNPIFNKLPNTVNTDDYTIYSSNNSILTASDNEFISNDSNVKKIILNNTTVSDFNANAAYKIGSDGNLKAGIIFRAQSVGNDTDEMEGYSAVLFKTPGTTKNYSRIVMLVYKWARTKDGKAAYLGTVDSFADTTTLKEIYPETENSILSSAGIPLKLNLEVKENKATVSFDVFDSFNCIVKSSPVKTFDITKNISNVSENFDDDAINTVYNAGNIGLSISTKGEIIDFNLTADEGYQELWTHDASQIQQYSSDNNSLLISEGKAVSATVGYKQALIKNLDVDALKIEADLTSSGAGTFNMGFDFFVNESTHSGSVTNVRGFEGWRVTAQRGTGNGITLYLFQFIDNGDGTYTRPIVKNVSDSSFFENYSSINYGNVSVKFTAVVKDGDITVIAALDDKTVTLTQKDTVIGTGTAGLYICNGGSILNSSIKALVDNSLITSETVKNGSVYAGINSGAARIGEQVKVLPFANEGCKLIKVYKTVDGAKLQIQKDENGYVFNKEYGETVISADFAVIGDLDGDDKANASDAAILRKVLLGSESIEDIYADVNEDNIVNIMDIVRIKKVIVG